MCTEYRTIHIVVIAKLGINIQTAMLGTREYTLCSPFRANAHNSSLEILLDDRKVVEIHIFFIWWLLILAKFINSPISPIIYRFTVYDPWVIGNANIFFCLWASWFQISTGPLTKSKLWKSIVSNPVSMLKLANMSWCDAISCACCNIGYILRENGSF